MGRVRYGDSISKRTAEGMLLEGEEIVNLYLTNTDLYNSFVCFTDKRILIYEREHYGRDKEIKSHYILPRSVHEVSDTESGATIFTHNHSFDITLRTKRDLADFRKDLMNIIL